MGEWWVGSLCKTHGKLGSITFDAFWSNLGKHDLLNYGLCVNF